MDLTSIVLLLQTALALLSTPNMSVIQMQKVNLFVNQAINLAAQALAQNTPNPILATPSPTIPLYSPPVQGVPYTPPTYPRYNPPPPPIPSAPESPPIVETPVAPSCKLVGTVSLDAGDNLSATFNWILTGMSSDTEGEFYVQDGQNAGRVTYDMPPTKLNETSRNKSRSDLLGIYKASFGDINCWAFFPRGRNSKIGDMTSSSVAENFPQLTL